MISWLGERGGVLPRAHEGVEQKTVSDGPVLLDGPHSLPRATIAIVRTSIEVSSDVRASP